MKAIEDLIKTYQLEIRNIRLDIAKLNREAETLHDVVSDLQEIVQENKIKKVTDYVQLGSIDKRKGLDKEEISKLEKVKEIE